MQKDDVIYRQAAIEIVDFECGEWRGLAKTITKRLSDLPPAQQWIPVTERLPKPFEYCLWTTTDGRVVYHHCDGLFSKYTAWMPLPKPYKERREE